MGIAKERGKLIYKAFYLKPLSTLRPLKGHYEGIMDKL
jgi:hypothetical protein